MPYRAASSRRIWSSIPAVTSGPSTAFDPAVQAASLASAVTVQVVVAAPPVTLSNVFAALARRTRNVPFCNGAGAAALTWSAVSPAV